MYTIRERYATEDANLESCLLTCHARAVRQRESGSGIDDPLGAQVCGRHGRGDQGSTIRGRRMKKEERNRSSDLDSEPLELEKLGTVRCYEKWEKSLALLPHDQTFSGRFKF